MCLPTKHGSLGIRDMEKTNLALVLHISWRTITNEPNLATRILWGKNFHNSKPSVGCYSKNNPLGSGVVALRESKTLWNMPFGMLAIWRRLIYGPNPVSLTMKEGFFVYMDLAPFTHQPKSLNSSPILCSLGYHLSTSAIPRNYCSSYLQYIHQP